MEALLAMICEGKMKIDNSVGELLLDFVLSLLLESQNQNPNVRVEFHSTFDSEDFPYKGTISNHRYFYIHGNFVEN